jgi:hypothetical protein
MRILTCKCSHLKPEVTQSMMFLKENSHLVCKYYAEIAPAYHNKDLKHLVPFELKFLRKISDIINVKGGEMDVGQHDGDSFSSNSNTRHAG